jgi:hypothetical protein
MIGARRRDNHPGPRFALLVHHNDAVREWAYDRDPSIGQLDKALDEANAKGWTVVDMKNDWRLIFPFEYTAGIDRFPMISSSLRRNLPARPIASSRP